MRAIKKRPEPVELQKYRAIPGAKFDGKDFTPIKDKVREALLGDQLRLCCYCMRRISDESLPHPKKPDAPPVVQMKVEHWQSQHSFPALQLAWTNMLGACLGGEGSPKSDQTCDTRKGEDEIALNPLDPAHVSTLNCRSTGRLQSTNARFQEDIDVRLGLNHRILVSERKARLDRALNQLKAKYPRSELPKGALRSLVDELEAPAAGKLPELCNVLRLWARKRYGGSL